VLKDITELVNIEYARSIEQLSEIMIASTSHDMRTPLNTIINMLTLIDESISGPLTKSWIKVAFASTNLLMNLVNATLDYFQIKSNKFLLRYENFTITDLITSCFDMISF